MVTNASLIVEPLAQHPWACAELASLFEIEWPDWYGLGGRASAEADVGAFCAAAGLPFGVVALRDGEVCGVAALKAGSIPSHRHLLPWAAAGLVKPSLRGQGIGASLLAALESQARAQGFSQIHCAMVSAASLLGRRGWSLLEHITHEGQLLGIYSKGL